MEPVTVLVIEEGAAEAALVCAALALHPRVRVLDVPDLERAIERTAHGPIALAIAGARALARSPDKLVSKLGAHGIPVVGIAAGLESEARERALAAGVREVHDRPGEWRAYSELVGALVGRFIQRDLSPRRGPTS